MVHLLASSHTWPAYLLEPLWGWGYQFWSGIGSDFSEVTLLAGLYVLLKKHNCHVRHCWRLQWKEHDGDLLCKKHHPHDPPTAAEVG